ncbi:hypothetical protein R3P38DRAFT_2806660 [Favolaschia claudopus]|uniref:Uncharacterized protein n=1 Tax=Favolaschia claudopus TaxID=2862362 RepID=A0AAV9ZJ53_9AGAR
MHLEPVPPPSPLRFGLRRCPPFPGSSAAVSTTSSTSTSLTLNLLLAVLLLGHPPKKPITSSDAAHIDDIANILFCRDSVRVKVSAAALHRVVCVPLSTAWCPTSGGLSSELEGSLLNLASRTAYRIGHKYYNTPPTGSAQRDRCVKAPQLAIGKGSDID